ncbi:FAD-linked oxidase C-terminal domain-containing protein [Peristeroidobacter soli]
MIDEFGPAAVELMCKLKDAWDPNGILNPGKVFDLK